jgi:glycosyltransferase involved in cell wall biosynthesis
MHQSSPQTADLPSGVRSRPPAELPVPAGQADERSARPRPKVLYVDHTAALGGGEIALLNLVRNVDPGRYQPVVLLFAEGDLADKLRRAGIECHVLPVDASVLHTRKDSIGVGSLLRAGLLLGTIRHVLRVARFIRRNDVALVHANSLKADVIGGLAARLARRPLIWHVRDRIAGDYLPGPVVAAFRLLAKFVPTRVVANSGATLATLRPRHDGGDRRSQRYTVVHDGTEAGADPVEAAPAGPAAGPLVGIVGRISPWKGQHVFLRAAAEVHRRFPPARFQIIGSALFSEQAYEQEVRTLCTQLGLDGVVEFTGFRSDVPDLIGRLDVLVHASTTGEPFGQVVIEGMAAAKPVVATNGGGVPEIVQDGGTGLLVPMGDPAAMADAIARLLADPDLRRRMGRAGRQRVLEHFTIQRTAEGVQRVYDALLGGISG